MGWKLSEAKRVLSYDLSKEIVCKPERMTENKVKQVDCSGRMLPRRSQVTQKPQSSQHNQIHPPKGQEAESMKGPFSRLEPKLSARDKMKFPNHQDRTIWRLLAVDSLVCIMLLLHVASCNSQSAEGSPPRITIQPNDLIAIEGESTELNCDAEGDPEPTIEWFHNGQLIKSSTHSRTTMGGSIQFLDIRSSSSPNSNGKQTDTGIYYCLAKNSLGQEKSRNASLQVAYIKPEFRLEPRDKLVAIGDSVSFDCLPEAWPEPNIRWRFNDRLIDPKNSPKLADGSAKYTVNRIASAHLNNPIGVSNSGDIPATKSGSVIKNATATAAATTTTTNLSAADKLVDEIGSQLLIREVDKNDEGKYTCLVETRGTHRMIERESASAQISALVKPFFVEAPEQRTSAQVGGQVRLRCRMGGDPEPVISWRKQNGQPMSAKTQIDPVDKTLILDQLTLADQGTYVCEGENAIGSARSSATVLVISRPKFIVQPEDQEVEQGATVQFKCSGDASPAPMLYWYKEGHRQLIFAPSFSRQPPSGLDWPQAAPLIAPQSSYSSDTSPSINKLFSMSLTPEQLNPSSFSNSYFGNRIYVDNTGRLNIVNVTSSDNGYYACALISSVGSVLAKAKLTVRHSPNSSTDASDYYGQDSPIMRSMGFKSKFDLYPPPVIKFGSANQTLPTNTSVTLACDVVSQVSFRIQWFFESLPLDQESSRILFLETGALSINNLRSSDAGIYTCVVSEVENQVMPLATPSESLDTSMLTSAPPIQHTTSHSVMLKVASPLNPNIRFYRMDPFAYPSSPGPASLVTTNGNDAITIAWQAPSDQGKLPSKGYIIEHYDTSQEHSGWRVIYKTAVKETLLVDGLSPDGSHFFVIRATNGHGAGPSSNIAGPFRTLAGEARYQAELQRNQGSDYRRANIDLSSVGMRPDTSLAREKLGSISTNLLSLTPISSTSIRLKWLTQIMGNSSSAVLSESTSGNNFPLLSAPDISDYLEGYSVRYRAIGIGESLLSKDPLLGVPNWPVNNINSPSSLPLVTSYIDPSEEPLSRKRRDLMNYFDYSQEFREIRVAKHDTEQYIINELQPFTQYLFFIVPYYKDIDGVPSNMLIAQTNEDRPAIGPSNLAVRPINSTSVRLLWTHVPPRHANGILRSYVARINCSDSFNGFPDQPQSFQSTTIEPTRILNLPLGSLSVAQPPSFSLNSDTRAQSTVNSNQQYIVMFDLTNLTHKSFYSVQVAAATNVGPGPWSESQNFVMDPKVLSQLKASGNEFDDFMSKSLILTAPNFYGGNQGSTSAFYWTIPMILVIASILLVAGYLLYQRNNQRVITWKKTISEHFTNKFYMPSTVDHRGSNSIQQNIYGHQQHLIYSGSTHIPQQTLPAQTMWVNNGCINSSGTGSISSHGGLLPISNDTANLARRVNGQQVLLNNKEMRFVNNNSGQSMSQSSVNPSRTLGHQIIHHGGDYYSVINNMAEYEELDPQQRNNMHMMTNADRHQTASSNSDTSCPSSVTKLLPNQNYNRDLMSKTFGDNHLRHETVLQQQTRCIDGKQPFATMINGDAARLQSMVPLSPYATTNLMNQGTMPQQIFVHPQMSLIDQSRQQNFVTHNGNCGGVTLDDSSKALMNQQQMNGVQNHMAVFRTLQRNPVNFHSRSQLIQGQAQRPTFMQTDSFSGTDFQNQNQLGGQLQNVNITSNPAAEMDPNLYEHIEYDNSHNHQPASQPQKLQQQQQRQLGTQTHDIISSSTSSGSMKSSSQQHSPDQQSNLGKQFRRGSGNADFEKEAHDLRVFSSPHATRQVDSSASERLRLNVNADLHSNEENCDDDDANQADETTAFKQKFSQSDNQRTKQLNKRKRQQQRNRLHNNNQKIG